MNQEALQYLFLTEEGKANWKTWYGNEQRTRNMKYALSSILVRSSKVCCGGVCQLWLWCLGASGQKSDPAIRSGDIDFP